MRIFQNSALYPSYVPRLRQLTRGLSSFDAMRAAFLADRFGAPHFLQPVLDGQEDAFFTNGDDPELQKAWAKENGLAASASLSEILLAQVEHHGADVFYNLDPVAYDSAFIRRLPGCVRRTVAWRAAPLGRADLTAYDLVVSNFPGILEQWARSGLRTGLLYPGHDPVMDSYAANEARPVDVLFIGSYGRLHRARADLLERVAALHPRFTVEFCLDRTRVTRLADTPLGWIPPLSKYSRPASIRRVSQGPVFGRQLYEKISSAKIVVNGAIDMAGASRGNMRCFEAMGLRSALVSDTGDYPGGMEPGRSMFTYSTVDEAARTIESLLEAADGQLESVSRSGYDLMRTRYSNSEQWTRFQAIVGI